MDLDAFLATLTPESVRAWQAKLELKAGALLMPRFTVQYDRSLADALRAEGIGANVHYAPVYSHSYYRNRGYAPGLCPVAERASKQLLTLPMFPAMTEDDVNRVVEALTRATA